MNKDNPKSKKTIWILVIVAVFLAAGISFFAFRRQVMSLFDPDKGKGIYAAFDDARPNIIMILVDALRVDSLGCYGSARGASPNTDAFAGRSIIFERANSQATCTFPSVNSMFTSRHPFLFVRKFAGENFGVPDDIPYLPAILKENGYATLACSSSPIVRNTPSVHNKIGGFGRGFDIFLEPEWDDAEVMNKAVLKEMKKLRKPLFLYMHYMDPHDPYDPPDKFKRMFCSPYDDKDFIAEGKPNPIFQMITGEGPSIEISERDLQHLRDLYEGEVAFYDFQFGRFTDRLSDMGILENSLVIICADHGEEFFEHENVKHCNSVFETLVHVPLIIKTPSNQPQGTRKSLVQNLDIAPTILDYADIDPGEYGFQGKSLKPVIEKDEKINPYAYCVQHNWRSISDGRFKLIIGIRTGEIALYDLQNDPRETMNVLDSEPNIARHLVKALKEWISREEAGLTPDDRIKMSEETLKKLKALGYFK